MPKRITFHAVTPQGAPGDELGAAMVRDGEVAATPGVAADTVDMLSRRTGRPAAEVVDLLAAKGWSNGQIMVKLDDTTP